MSKNNQVVAVAKRELKMMTNPRPGIDPSSGLPSYYSTIGGPLYGQQFGVAGTEKEAAVVGEARKEVVKEAEKNAAAKQTVGSNKIGFNQLEKDAGLSMRKKKLQPLGTLTADRFRQAGSTALIIAGVLVLAFAALLIWPAAAAIRQAKALSRYDHSSDTAVRGERPKTNWAMGMSVTAAIIAGLGVIGSIVGAVNGSAIGIVALFMVTMLVVGAVAASRLNKPVTTNAEGVRKNANRGDLAHATSGLWITGVVLLMILPALAAIVFGSVLAASS